jgi:transposase
MEEKLLLGAGTGRAATRSGLGRTMKAGEARRAKVILRLAAGQSYRTIMRQEGWGQDFVDRWKERFRAKRLAGLMPGIVAKLSPRTSSAKKPRFSTTTKQPAS